MTDIQNRTDIETLVNTFYERVREDQTIGHFFTKIASVNWDTHLPKMYDFWESLIFVNAKYKGNPMIKHLDINKIAPLNARHFNHWLKLWELTLKNSFKGPNCDIALAKAKQIAGLIQFKIERMSTGKNIL